MDDPIIVQPTGPMGWMPPETVDDLIEVRRMEGLDFWISCHQQPGYRTGEEQGT